MCAGGGAWQSGATFAFRLPVDAHEYARATEYLSEASAVGDIYMIAILLQLVLKEMEL